MVAQHIKDKLAQHRNATVFFTQEVDHGKEYHAYHFYSRRENNKIFLIEALVHHDEQHRDYDYDSTTNTRIISDPYPKSSKRSRIVGYYSIDTDHFHFWHPCTMNGYMKCKYNDPAIKKLLPNNMWHNVLSNREPTAMGDMYVQFVKHARDLALTDAIEASL